MSASPSGELIIRNPTAAAPAAPATLGPTISEKIQKARENAKKQRGWIGYAQKKLFGQNNASTKKRVLNSLKNEQAKSQYEADQLVKSNFNFCSLNL